MPALPRANSFFCRGSVFKLFRLLILLSVGIPSALAKEPPSLDESSRISVAGPIHVQSDPVGTATIDSADRSKSAGEVGEAVQISEVIQVDDRIAARLRLLQKPLGEIEFVRAPEAARAPASAVLTAESAWLITHAAHPVRPNNRYAIAAQHNPLYFQELNLERCGNTWGCAQTLVSACQFFGNVLALPYRVAERPWCSIENDRLDCQSGGRLPCAEPLQPSGKGLALETAVITGIAFLLL